MKRIFIKDFLISKKVKPKRIEHLQKKGIISSELYFSGNTVSDIMPCEINILIGTFEELLENKSSGNG